jgi:hypothetical protein
MKEDAHRRELRELYEKALASGLGRYVYLEDLAKRFSFADLKYLFEGGDKLKFTYLYPNDTDLPHGEELCVCCTLSVALSPSASDARA